MKIQHSCQDEWEKLGALTGVTPLDIRPANNTGQLSIEEFWLLIDKIANANLSPRNRKQYKAIVALMFHLKLSLSQVLSLRKKDLHISLKKAILKANLEVYEELMPLFQKFEDSEFIFPRSVHRRHSPLSRMAVEKLILMSGSLLRNVSLPVME